VVAEPPAVVTVTVTGPAEPAGAVMLIAVPVLAMMVDALMPKVTEALDKFVPVIFTQLPPAVGPDIGNIEAIVGGLNAKVAEIICDATTFVNWYDATFPTELPSTNTSAIL